MKRDHRQMDLFDYRPPATVVRLPLAVWGRTVWGETADAFVDHMVARPDRNDFWWRGVDHQIGQDLRKLHLSESDVQAEVNRARQYVARKLAVMTRERQHNQA